MASYSGVIKATVTVAVVGGLFTAGTLSVVAGIAAYRLGPIDATRTVYNNIIGDSPVLKQALVDYCRENIGQYDEAGINFRKKPNSEEEIEKRLADILDVPLMGGEINPQQAGIEELWDASEKCAPNLVERYVWPTLKK